MAARLETDQARQPLRYGSEPSYHVSESSYQGSDLGKVSRHLPQHGTGFQVPQLKRLLLEDDDKILPEMNEQVRYHKSV